MTPERLKELERYALKYQWASRLDEACREIRRAWAENERLGESLDDELGIDRRGAGK